MKILPITLFLSLIFINLAFSGSSPSDDLLNDPGPVGDVTRRRLGMAPQKGEYPEDTERRYAREQAQKALLAALVPNKVRVTQQAVWNLPKESIVADVGMVLNFVTVSNGFFLIRYKSYELSLPVSQGTIVPADPEAVAVARERIKLLSEEEQARVLQKQLSELNHTLREIRDIADERR